jgi:hypothetical protein
MNQQIPFVVYSGERASLADEEPAFANGEYLSKPALPEEVIAALKRALAAGGHWEFRSPAVHDMRTGPTGPVLSCWMS